MSKLEEMIFMSWYMYKPIPLFLTCLFLSAAFSKNASNKSEFLFEKPKNRYEKAIYQLTKPFVYTWAHPSSSNTLFSITGYKKQKSLALEFLNDIGAESIQIKTHDKALIDGIYLNPKTFESNKLSAFIKWKQQFKNPKYSKLASIFEINQNANNFEELFNFPKNVKNIKFKKQMGAVCLPACGLIYELDPKYILNFLLRGLHVVSINYRGLVNSKGLPNWKGTCLDGKYAYEWLKRQIHAKNSDLFITGKSFGSGPAVFTASQSCGSHLMLDRGFSRLSDVCTRNFSQPLRFLLTPFAKYFTEKHYRFPNDELITSVTGKFLIIEAKHDNYMKGQAKKLVKAYLKSKKNLSLKERTEFINQSIIQVSGGHFGIQWGDSTPSWYSDYDSQEKLNTFFNGFIN